MDVFSYVARRTLYESKGLEFDDVRAFFLATRSSLTDRQVLLFNFFEDSTVEVGQWRVVLNSLPDRQINCPRFEETRHSGVCREVGWLGVVGKLRC